MGRKRILFDLNPYKFGRTSHMSKASTLNDFLKNSIENRMPLSCFLSRSFNVKFGVVHGYGVQHVVGYLSKELLKLGVKCCIITRKTKTDKNFEMLDGIPILRVSEPYNVRSFLMRINLRHNFEFSVIHSHCTTDAMFHALYRKIQPQSAPFLVHVHHMPVNVPVPSVSRSRFVFEASDAVIVTNKTSKIRLHIYYGVPLDKISTIYNGVDPNIFRPDMNVISIKSKFDVKEHVVLFIGKFTSERGLHNIIYAAPRILSTHPNTTFLLVGFRREKKAYLMKLRKLCERLRVSKNVKFVDYIPHSLLPQVYAMADVFVMPDIFNEPSMTIFEAMACETPVVATNLNGCIPEYPPSLLNLKYGDNDKLAETIVELLSRPELAEKIGVHGRKIVEKYFTWKKVAENICSLYRRLTNSK